MQRVRVVWEGFAGGPSKLSELERCTVEGGRAQTPPYTASLIAEQ